MQYITFENLSVCDDCMKKKVTRREKSDDIVIDREGGSGEVAVGSDDKVGGKEENGR